jgi:hypothetical protein
VGLFSSNVTSTGAKLNWTTVSCANKYQLQYRNNGGAWQKLNVNGEIKTLTGLQPSTTYQWKVRSKCAVRSECLFGFLSVQVFTTSPLKEFTDETENLLAFEVYPNPFVTSATLEFFLHEKSPIQIEWCEMNGKKIRTITEGNFDAGRHRVVSPGKASLLEFTSSGSLLMPG